MSPAPRGAATGALLLLAAAALAPPATAATKGDFILTMWAGVAETGSSDATARQSGNPAAGASADFSPFLLIGTRVEAYPFVSSRAARHFGFGVDVVLLGGEADIELTPGSGREETTLTAGVITPTVSVRFPGRSWEGYGGVGSALVWGSRLDATGSRGFFDDIDDDAEVAVGLAAFAGARYRSEAGWYFVVEARRQTGRTDYTLAPPRTDVRVDWRLNQIVAGSGYRF